MRIEVDPNGIDPKQGGAKLDAGKTPAFQGLINYFPRACAMVSDVSGVGAKKYSWGGWGTVVDGFNRYSNALMRHLFAEGRGEKYDNGPGGTGMLHAAQVAWNALARLEMMLREEEKTQ